MRQIPVQVSMGLNGCRGCQGSPQQAEPLLGGSDVGTVQRRRRWEWEAASEQDYVIGSWPFCDADGAGLATFGL